LSPFGNRGISPFRRQRQRSSSFDSSSSDEYRRENNNDSNSSSLHRSRLGEKPNNVVVHPTARSIVFRDSVRRATKIIEEVELEEDDNEEEIEEADDDSSSSSLLMESGAIKPMHHHHSAVQSSRRRSSEILHQQFRVILEEEAQELVPEEAAEIITSLRDPQFSERNIEIQSQDYMHLKPLPPLNLGPNDEFTPLLESETDPQPDWTASERKVYELLKEQKACVKMIKNSEWPSFLHRFQQSEPKKTSRIRKYPTQHDDIAPHDDYLLNSFVTSTSLLPPLGKKMKTYGSLLAYQCGVIFALPDFSSDTTESEEEAVRRTETWAWPAGYAAKTEHSKRLCFRI
jgi:hypothetical protein